MKRTCDVAFSECPICGKKPYVETYDVTAAQAFCKGHGFHRHNKVYVCIPYERPSNLLKRLAQEWNQLGYGQARFLFYANGNPFKEVVKCPTCEHRYWHDPECNACDEGNGFKYYTAMKGGGASNG